MSTNKVHEGRNIKRFREMLGMKQEALAIELGSDWNQKRVSLLEAKEHIELPLLTQVAGIMKLPVEAFQNFDENQAINIISSTFSDHASVFSGNASIINNSTIIEPIDKLIKLHDEKIALYERMLKEKEEMMERLERLIEKR